MPATKRLPMTAPLQFTLERTLRCARYRASNSETSGTLLPKTLPLDPSAHCEGIDAGFCRYASQSARGAAGPTQMSCATADGNPVFDNADPTSCALGVF